MEHMPIYSVSSKDFQEFGCPYCGTSREGGHVMVSMEEYSLWYCANADCRQTCVVLPEGIKSAQVSFGQYQFNAELQPHPRRGQDGLAAGDDGGAGEEISPRASEASPQVPGLPPMEIFVLWHVEDLSQGYVDQFGIPHRAFVVVEHIPVMVVQKRAVLSLADGKQHEALRAVSMQTREAFTRDWAGFVAGSMAPGFHWDYRKDERGIWRPVDGCMAYNLKLFIPYVTPDGQRAVPMGAEICRMHDQAFLGDRGCIGCRVEAYRAAHAS